MKKSEKTVQQARGKGKKLLFLIFAFLVLVAVAIVLALTYWPAKTSDIINSFDSALSSSLDLNGDEYKTVNMFINDHQTEMLVESTKPDADPKYEKYYNEMISYPNIITSISKSFEFYKNTFALSVDGKYTRREVKKIDGNIKDATKKIEDISNYVAEYKDQATNFTIVNSIWEGLRSNYQKMLEDYVSIYQKIENLYYKGSLKGIYGNDTTLLSVTAMKQYLILTYKNLFTDEDNMSSANGYIVSQNMKNFVAIYQYKINDENPFENIIHYYNNEICQKNIELIKNVESLTENKVTFEYLIQNNFDTESLSLTTKTKKYADAAAKFLRAKNVTHTLLVPEGGE